MEPKYFDIHSHVQFEAYDQDRDDVIARALEAGVYMMNVGTQKDTSIAAVELAEKYQKEYKEKYPDGRDGGVYAAVAQHPTCVTETFDPQFYETLARKDVVKAIGECGLDYFRLETDTIELQKKVFIEHIELANKVNKPLMLHIRNGTTGPSAYQDAIDILKAHARVKGDVHFFAGDWGIAKQFLDIGFTLSFTGVLTFTTDYDEVVRNIPLDMIMSETDCPYITPVPFRGKRNEPMHVREVVKAIARIKNEDEEKVRVQLIANAQSVFNF